MSSMSFIRVPTSCVHSTTAHLHLTAAASSQPCSQAMPSAGSHHCSLCPACSAAGSALPEKQRPSSTRRRPMRTGCSLQVGMVRETMSSFSASVASLDGENSPFGVVLSGSRSIDDAAMVRLAVGRLACLRNRSTVSEDTGYQTPRAPGHLHCTMTCPVTGTEYPYAG